MTINLTPVPTPNALDAPIESMMKRREERKGWDEFVIAGDDEATVKIFESAMSSHHTVVTYDCNLKRDGTSQVF